MDCLEQLTEELKEGVSISAQFEDYKESFIEILLQCKLMLNSYRGCMKFSKHRVDFLQLETVPVYTALFAAGPKRPNLEHSEVSKILANTNSKFVQTEQAATIVFHMK